MTENVSGNGDFRWENGGDFTIDSSNVSMPLEFRLGRREGDTEIDVILFHQNGGLTSNQLDAILASVATSVAGDFDEDGDVDGVDFLFWQRNGLSPTELIEWEANYGMPSSPVLSRGAVVPEPGSGWLILGAALCHWIVRSR